MADIYDQATAQEEQALQRALAIQQARAASEPKLAARGHCINIRCGDDFPPGDARLFCDSRCAAEHQRFSKN